MTSSEAEAFPEDGSLMIHGWHLEILTADQSGQRVPAQGQLLVTVEDARPIEHEAPTGRLMVATACLTATNRPYALTESDDAFILRNFGFFEAHIAKTFDRVSCWTDPSVPADMMPVLITGNLMNFIMWLAGDIGLHASTVMRDSSLIAVMGARNMGKSTCASALVGAGCAFFGDDLLRVTLGDPIIGHRGTSAARLRTSAWDLGSKLPGTFADAVTFDGRRNLAFDLPAEVIAPIGVVLVPRIDRAAPDLSLEIVSWGRAVELYHRLARINGVNDRRMVETYLNASAELARSVPFVEVTMPFNDGPLPSLGDGLLAVLASVGLIRERN